jgi:hypothetical protein
MQPISLEGPPALPMPVEISDAKSLDPFFAHLYQNGSSDLSTLGPELSSYANEFEETYYGTKALEFPKALSMRMSEWIFANCLLVLQTLAP